MTTKEKMIFAASTATPATPPKPNMAAMMAITRNVRAQPSMIASSSTSIRRRVNVQCATNVPQFQFLPPTNRKFGTAASEVEFPDL